jgi:hypothetical protein
MSTVAFHVFTSPFNTCYCCLYNHAGGKKTRLERAGAPAFSSLIEAQGNGKYRVYPDLARSVDLKLANEF